MVPQYATSNLPASYVHASLLQSCLQQQLWLRLWPWSQSQISSPPQFASSTSSMETVTDMVRATVKALVCTSYAKILLPTSMTPEPPPHSLSSAPLPASEEFLLARCCYSFLAKICGGQAPFLFQEGACRMRDDLGVHQEEEEDPFFVFASSLLCRKPSVSPGRFKTQSSSDSAPLTQGAFPQS